MHAHPTLAAFFLVATALHAQGAVVDADAHAWPSYHGKQGSGVADGFDTPVTWDVEDGVNIAWSTPLPGLSHSSPIIWGDRVYVTTAVKEGDAEAELRVGLYGDIQPVEDDTPHEFRLLCLDRLNGEVLWSSASAVGPNVQVLRPVPGQDQSFTGRFHVYDVDHVDHDAPGTLLHKSPVLTVRPGEVWELTTQ